MSILHGTVNPSYVRLSEVDNNLGVVLLLYQRTSSYFWLTMLLQRILFVPLPTYSERLRIDCKNTDPFTSANRSLLAQNSLNDGKDEESEGRKSYEGMSSDEPS